MAVGEFGRQRPVEVRVDPAELERAAVDLGAQAFELESTSSTHDRSGQVQGALDALVRQARARGDVPVHPGTEARVQAHAIRGLRDMGFLQEQEASVEVHVRDEGEILDLEPGLAATVHRCPRQFDPVGPHGEHLEGLVRRGAHRERDLNHQRHGIHGRRGHPPVARVDRGPPDHLVPIQVEGAGLLGPALVTTEAGVVQVARTRALAAEDEDAREDDAEPEKGGEGEALGALHGSQDNAAGPWVSRRGPLWYRVAPPFPPPHPRGRNGTQQIGPKAT